MVRAQSAHCNLDTLLDLTFRSHPLGRSTWQAELVHIVQAAQLFWATILGHMYQQTLHLLSCCVGLWLQWRAFGPGHHVDRPSPGGPLQHYTRCMPLRWPPPRLAELQVQGIPDGAVQAAAAVRYGKSIANMFWVEHASTAHSFMYRCGRCWHTDATWTQVCMKGRVGQRAVLSAAAQLQLLHPCHLGFQYTAPTPLQLRVAVCVVEALHAEPMALAEAARCQ